MSIKFRSGNQRNGITDFAGQRELKPKPEIG